jgi:hypothetical protein
MIPTVVPASVFVTDTISSGSFGPGLTLRPPTVKGVLCIVQDSFDLAVAVLDNTSYLRLPILVSVDLYTFEEASKRQASRSN